MKKIFSYLLIVFSFSTIQSQEIADALRYAQDNLTGTARFRAMSGAFGALGGDLSSIGINPAGSVIFANNQLGFSLSNYNVKNNSNYFGTNTSDHKGSVDLNQLGAVFVFKNYDENSGWRKFAVAINYDNTNNLNNSVYSAGYNSDGISHKASVANYFVSYANQSGISLSTLQNSYYEDLNNFGAQQAFLGYQGYIINPSSTYNDFNNRTYVSNVPGGGSYRQENSFYSKGYNGKLVFNAAAQYQNWLSFGINLNSHFTDYTQETNFYESNNNSTSTGVRNLLFSNKLYTYGSGFSFQAGAIFKIYKGLRLGLAYDSPTWYRLNDEVTQSLSSNGFGYGTPPNVGLSGANVNPGVTVVYDPYNLRTPSKYSGSLAYVFGKKGMLNIDLCSKNYSSLKFKPANQFTIVNSDMASLLSSSLEIKIGGEIKVKKWSIRGGYRYEQSPYVDKTTVGDLKGFSSGLGYNFGHTKLDLAYTHSKRDSQLQFFSQGMIDRAMISNLNNNLTFSVAFEL